MIAAQQTSTSAIQDIANMLATALATPPTDDATAPSGESDVQSTTQNIIQVALVIVDVVKFTNEKLNGREHLVYI